MTNPTWLAAFLIFAGGTALLFSTASEAQDTDNTQQVDTLNFTMPEADATQNAGDSAALDSPESERRRIELGADAKVLWEKGYPKPDEPDLDNYNDETIEKISKTLKGIEDPCEKAVYLKHALDAGQDDYVLYDLDMMSQELLAEVGLKIAVTVATRRYGLPSNFFDAAKIVKDVGTRPGFGTPAIAENVGASELEFASMLSDIASVYQAIDKLPRGSLKAHIGRFKLMAYENARQLNWSADRIAEERRSLDDKTQILGKEVHALRDNMLEKAEERKNQHLQRMSDIDAKLEKTLQDLAADEAVEGEKKRRLKRLEDPEFIESLMIGSEIAIESPDFGQHKFNKMEAYRQNWKDYYVEAALNAKVAAVVDKASEAVEYEKYVRLLGRETNAEISNRLAQMQLIAAQSETLKTYAAPVAEGDCKKLRKTPPIPREEAEALVIDRLKQLDKPRFDALMANSGVTVPSDFYACLCEHSGTAGVGGSMKFSEGKCWAIGVLGGSREVKIAGHGNTSNWKTCLDKVTVTTPLHGAETRMQDILIDKLRDMPGRRIE